MGGTAVDLSAANLSRIAVAMTKQPWDTLGLEEAANNDETTATAVSLSTLSLQLRATAILMTRVAAIAAPRLTYTNLATSTIGQTVLVAAETMAMTNHNSSSNNSNNNNKNRNTNMGSWPGLEQNGHVVAQQVYRFVGRMFQGYKQVPYHNQDHAFHVLQSITKLMDLMIVNGGKTYGLKYDPLALFSLVFAALIHDVEHQGIPVRSMVIVSIETSFSRT
jgi:3'5'-cyclic nucleotide phosphodiesterase